LDHYYYRGTVLLCDIFNLKGSENESDRTKNRGFGFLLTSCHGPPLSPIFYDQGNSIGRLAFPAMRSTLRGPAA
jgi:hypothetical protein